MFSDEIARLVIAAANKNNIKPSALLAVVECETAGAPFESDGKTPRFLYERHVAFRHARAAGASWLKAFVSAGLAIPKWDRKNQYKDQKTSAMRLALIARARNIHEEIANASASWGLGQSMGENGPELGFASATALVKYMVEGGLPAQIDVLIREIKSKKLIKALNDLDFAAFARKYNGPGYKQNQYDTRMAAAERRWARTADKIVTRETPEWQKLSQRELKVVQAKLSENGYKMVGTPDGKWGPNTIAAVTAFQEYEGLPTTSDLDAVTMAELKTAEPRVLSKQRVSTTAEDLKDDGSRIVNTADAVSKTGTAAKVGGIGLALLSTADTSGVLDTAQGAVDKVGQAKGLWDTIHEWITPFTSNPTTIVLGLGVAVGGYFLVKWAVKIIEARLEDYRSGAHA